MCCISSHLLSPNTITSSPSPLPTSLSPQFLLPCASQLTPYHTQLPPSDLLPMPSTTSEKSIIHHASCSPFVVIPPYPDWRILREGRLLLLYQPHPVLQKTATGETAPLHWNVDKEYKIVSRNIKHYSVGEMGETERWPLLPTLLPQPPTLC